MTDYKKLTVVKLRDELKTRGLQQTGLKAALVARLEEDDQNNAAQPVVPATGPAPAITADTTQPKAPESDSVPAPSIPASPAPSEKEAKMGVEAKAEARPNADTEAKAGADAKLQAETGEEIANTNARASATRATQIAQPEAQQETKDSPPVTGSPLSAPSAREDVAEPKSEIRSQTAEDKETLEQVKPSAPMPSVQDVTANMTPIPSTETPASSIPPTAPPSQIVIPATQTSIDTTEELEDSRKRKRRSRSPAPLTQDIAMKKLKAEDGSPRALSQEDTLVVRPSAIDTAKAESASDAVPSPAKPSPADARFKGLFAPAPAITKQSTQSDANRDVAPAQHPATTALYIRNLMRPLQSNALRDHLHGLAASGEGSAEQTLIREFFLDNIKSHCLVQFATLTAASSVRSALHEAVWPEEKSRKPLWVDYVPEEKLRTWIEMEQGATDARPPKRWEVVYEHDGDDVAAFLQEVDRPAPRGPRAGAPHSGRGATDASSTAPSRPRGDPGRGFQALDDLFRSTAAKPKLYFLPVSNETAQARLDRLAAGRGGGRDEAMRRFTFEAEELVDDGPEYRPGYRGGLRGRGGGGGYGRGGGRGDSWRGR